MCPCCLVLEGELTPPAVLIQTGNFLPLTTFRINPRRFTCFELQRKLTLSVDPKRTASRGHALVDPRGGMGYHLPGVVREQRRGGARKPRKTMSSRHPLPPSALSAGSIRCQSDPAPGFESSVGVMLSEGRTVHPPTRTRPIITCVMMLEQRTSDLSTEHVEDGGAELGRSRKRVCWRREGGPFRSSRHIYESKVTQGGSPKRS